MKPSGPPPFSGRVTVGYVDQDGNLVPGDGSDLDWLDKPIPVEGSRSAELAG